MKGICMSCVIEAETKIRAKGLWDDYQKKIKLENMKSWVRDQKKQFEEFMNSSESLDRVKRGDLGELEKWSADLDKEKIKEEFEEFISEYEEEMDKLEDEINEDRLSEFDALEDLVNGGE